MLQPTRLISTPFAQEGEKTEIQNVTGEFDNSATYRLGFPPLTMQSIRLGGKPPKGTDFNGVLFDITENISFLCKGGRYQYNAGLSTLIGGYPKGSNLLLDDNITEVVSTVAGNQNNPNINMTGWILKPNKTTAVNVADASGETQQQVNYNGGSKWHSRVGGYLENERVALANGDIVKSTIDGNTSNPNVNMTGWVRTNSASQIKYEDGIDAQTVKDRIVYIQDFGGAYNDFDPSVAESEAKAIANPSSKPYDGARQFAFPMRTLKVWNYCDGYKDRGAVASFSNVDSFDAPEPVTQVLGVSGPQGLIEYKDRDVVGIYNAVGSQKALLKSTNTTFSATSVTCPDFVISDLRKDQIIDVVDGAEKYSSIVESVSGNTVTIVDGWYKHSVLGDKGTPTNGSQLILVPNTKVWGQNTNVFISEDSDVHSFAGFEMGVFNYKADGMGYGYDIWNGGSKQTGQGYQTRGQFNVGFYAFEGTQIGFVAKDSAQIGFYANGGVEGFQSQSSNYSFTAKSPVNYAFRVLDSNNVFLSGITSNGAQERFKLTQTSETGNTISNFSVVSIFNAPSNNFVVDLPNPADNYQRVIYVKNINADNAILLAGSVEGGTGSLPLPTRSTLQLFCDGSAWYPISKHSFA